MQIEAARGNAEVPMKKLRSRQWKEIRSWAVQHSIWTSTSSAENVKHDIHPGGINAVEGRMEEDP